MTIKTTMAIAGAMFAGLVVASCNTTQNAPVQAAAADGTAYAAPLDERALAGHSCGQPIIAYRRLIDRDVRTGFLSQSVYDKIAPRIATAAASCVAGNEGGARASLAETKRAFGYPA